MRDEWWSCKAHPKTAWIILCPNDHRIDSAKLPGTCLHNYLRDTRIRIGGAECLQKKILLLVPDLLVAGRRYWLGSGRFSVLLAEQGCHFGVGLQKKVKHLKVVVIGFSPYVEILLLLLSHQKVNF